MQGEDVKVRRASVRVERPVRTETRHASMMLPRTQGEWMQADSFELWCEQTESFQALVRNDSSSLSFCSISSPADSIAGPAPAYQPFSHSVISLFRTRPGHLYRTPCPDPDEAFLRTMIITRNPTPFEVVDQYDDNGPALELRKAVMRLWQAFRQLCRVVVDNSVFQLGIISAILMNTVLLALEDPSLSRQPEPYHSMEIVLLYVYTGEMLLKQTALGLFSDSTAYFRDNWNLLDCLVVLTGWMDVYSAGSSVNLSALRALRILRPLRSITRIQGMKLVFTSLLGSTKAILSSITLLLFFYLITSIAALQMFMGVLKNRCVDLETGYTGSSWDDSRICGGQACPSGSVCIKGLDNPNYGKSNFDNILMSMLTLFQSVTLEGWTVIRIALEKGFNVGAVFFFVPVIYLGAFFFNNMTLVAMKSAFAGTLEAQIIKAKQRPIDSEDTRPLDLSLSSLPSSRSSLHFQSRSIGSTLRHYSALSSLAKPALFSSRRSEDNLDLPSLSLESRDPVPAAVKEGSPLSSVRSSRNAVHPEVAEDLPLTFREKESEGVKKAASGLFTEEKEARFTGKAPTSPFEEESFSHSDMRPTEKSTIGVTPELLFSKTPFIRRKLTKRQLARPKAVAYSISDEWQPDFTSKADVLPEKPNFLPLFDPFSPKRDCFMYQIASKSLSDDQSEQSFFPRFQSLCPVLTSKTAFVKVLPLAQHFVAAEFVTSTQNRDMCADQVLGHWSGSDVKPIVEEKVDLPGLNELTTKLWAPGFVGKMQKLIWPLRSLVSSSCFNVLMTICVVLNTVVLSIYHYGLDSAWSAALDQISFIFTVLFTVEMVVKMLGLGLLRYFRSKMNVFDCIVVVISLLELSLLSGSRVSAVRSFRVFRIFRVLRVARLFRYLNYMRTLLLAIEKSVANMLNMGLLILLFLVVAALFGMQLFGGKFDFPDGKPRENYDNFHYAFLTSFQLLTMENWFSVLYSGMRTNLSYFAAIYFVIWVFFGNFVLMNLFLAIMLNGFSEAEDDFETQALNIAEDSSASSWSRQSSSVGGRRKRKLNNLLRQIEALKAEDSLDSVSVSASADALVGTKPLFEGNECAKSWGVFSTYSSLRISCYRVTSSTRFEWCILVLILLSTLKLIWETYLLKEPSDSPQMVVSTYLDLVFTCLFGVEFLLKSTSLGFVCGKGTYLRDYWNVLDFCIVIMSFLDLALTDINIPIIKVFRLLRALRPLRFISHNESMRIIINALIESMGALASVAVVVLIVLLIFAILGVALMAGKMYKCSNPALTTQELCEYYGFAWQNSPYHYDNVISAYLSLFDLTSQENWPDQMYQGTDTEGEGVAMRTNCNPLMAYFFVVFVIIGNIFFLNLLLAVMFDKFEKAKKTYSSISVLILRNEQLRWVQLMKYIIRTKRIRPKKATFSPSRLFVQRLISHWAFHTVTMLAITGNMLIMAIAYDQASEEYNAALESVNLMFTCLFVVEACLKIYGLTVKGYFEERWNRFDFFLVITPFIDLVLSLTVFKGSSSKMISVGPQLARVLRILRVSRLLRMVKRLRMIDDLVGMLSLSLPAIGNVLMLLVLVFMIFGVLGVFLFHFVDSGLIIDDYNNFHNFGNSVLLLIRVSTGEDWNYVLHDLSAHVSSWQSSLFLLIFVSLTTFIMYNMFIMVMLQEYESYHNDPESSFKLYKEHLTLFNTAWNQCVTTENKARIDIDGLIEFGKMTGVITLRDNASKFEAREELGKKGFVVDAQGYIYYHDALFRFFRVKCGVMKRPTNKVYRKLLEREEQYHAKKIRQLIKIDKLEAAATYMHKGDLSEGAPMEFVDLVFLKSVFRSWLRYSGTARSVVSNTPAMSLVAPGCNSPRSVYEEESAGRERPPKISRMSTSWTKQRVDSQE